MDVQKPFLEQIKSAVPTANDVSKSVSATAQNFSDSIANVKAGVQNSLSEFSSKSIMNAGSEFLDSNGLLAKFAFIIFVLIMFMMVMKVAISILGYFMSPYGNPYVVRGLLDGSETAVVTQKPSDKNAVPILRSNDRVKGMEYTWSIWLKMKTASDEFDWEKYIADYADLPANGVTTKQIAIDHWNAYGKREGRKIESLYKNIFVKGDSKFAGTGINLLNGPGLYVKNVMLSPGVHEYKLSIVQDLISNTRDQVDVSSIPQNKWCHVAIRLQNMVMDIYVNGTIVKRHTMSSAPSQNYNDITVHGNGGFAGSTSNLRYYSYALNVFEINNIIMFGPDTKKSTLSDDTTGTGNFSYLSNLWYSGQY